MNEAIVDKINMVDVKHCKLKEDVDSFKMYTTQRLENQTKQIEQILLQMKKLLDAKTTSCGSDDNSNLTTADTLASPNLPLIANKAQSLVINIVVAAIALGTMAWLYAKICN